MADPWEASARWWQEGFTDGADPEYEEQILPLAARHVAGCSRVLDIGCGEGQLARLASRNGAQLVAGIDPVGSQLALARQRAGGPCYVQGGCSEVSFKSEAFEAVVVCLVFEDRKSVV